MKALSICEPFASAILDGHKLVENRTVRFSYRGLMLVHTTKRKEAWMDLAYGNPEIAKFLRKPEDLIHGCLRGVVELYSCEGPLVAKQVLPAQSHWITGPVCLLLRNPKPFPDPIPFLGHQFLFDVPNVVVAEQMQKVGLNVP